MSIVYLFLSIASSIIIAVLLKIVESRNTNRVVVIASNYIIAGTCAWIFNSTSSLNLPLVLFGGFLGLAFFLSFICFSKAIKENGVAAAITFGRISLAIPVILAFFLWNETFLPEKIIGIFLIIIIVFLWEKQPGKISPVLIIVFLLFGMIDSALKFFKIYFPAVDDGFFLILVFYSAMIWSWLYIFVSKTTINKTSFFSGLILGIPNFFSSFFLLKALPFIPAHVAFPLMNISMIVFTALIGTLIFKEQLVKRKIVLIALGIIAACLLSI
jgi:multidrug transporter EmrE-like cation transporter